MSRVWVLTHSTRPHEAEEGYRSPAGAVQTNRILLLKKRHTGDILPIKSGD